MQQNNLDISYVTLVRLPTGRAHGYAIMKMCERFAQCGARVELVVPKRSHSTLTENPFEYYHITQSFTLRHLFAFDISMRKEGSRIAFGIDQATFLLFVGMRRFPEILYTRDYQVALIARARRIALEVHTIPERPMLFLRAVRRAKKVIVISHGLKDALVTHGIPAAKILVAPDAVDLGEYDITPSREAWREYGVDPKKKIALYTGHFYGWKGADTFAEAAAYLPDDIQVVLMGGVDQELARFKKEYGDKRVHIIGYQPREKLAALLMTADALVLPNSARPKISSHYTSPLKLFQYMASGTPIVASDLPSIREILSEDTAAFFAPDDARALAHAIEKTLIDPAARQKAVRAKEHVRRYTWDARARAILDFIAV